MLGAMALLATYGSVLAACNVELSTGLGINDAQMKGSSFAKSDINQFGGLIAGGGGCDFFGGASGPFAGVFARYAAMHLIGDLNTQTLRSDHLWEAAGRLGYRWNDKWAPFVYVGWSGMNVSLPTGYSSKELTATNARPNLIGIGLDAHIRGNWWAGATVGYHQFDKQNVATGVDLQPNLVTAMVSLKYQFGDIPRAAPLK
jgi:opacity protein-like surface antigen